jgi:hypothetical protein
MRSGARYVGNCYIFNPAATVVDVTLNNGALGPIAAASADQDYAPQSIVADTSRHESSGVLGIAEPNVLSAFYPDDPQKEYGPYSVDICLSGRGVSVDDDLIIFVGRANMVVMSQRGFVLDTTCSSKLQPTGR